MPARDRVQRAKKAAGETGGREVFPLASVGVLGAEGQQRGFGRGVHVMEEGGRV